MGVVTGRILGVLPGIDCGAILCYNRDMLVPNPYYGKETLAVFTVMIGLFASIILVIGVMVAVGS